MKIHVLAGIAAMAAAGSAAMADTTLQFDVNAFAFQVRDAGGAASAFGGLGHTGSVDLSMAAGAELNEVSRRASSGGPFVDQGFAGVMTDFYGSIILDGGVVKGGSVTIEVDTAGDFDSYTADIVADSGTVKTFAGGGWTIDGLTFRGAFTDGSFGNVDVSDFFAVQGIGANLFGSYLQFNFNPPASGAGFADMDIFVTIPLPSAGLAGATGLAGLAGLGVIRRRR